MPIYPGGDDALVVVASMKTEMKPYDRIEITDRVPLLTPVNGDNRRYLAAKAARAGHSLDHLFEALSTKDTSIIPDKADAAS